MDVWPQEMFCIFSEDWRGLKRTGEDVIEGSRGRERGRESGLEKAGEGWRGLERMAEDVKEDWRESWKVKSET